jgi:hypothetical protein
MESLTFLPVPKKPSGGQAKINRSRRQAEVGFSSASGGFFLGLLFDLEDGRDTSSETLGSLRTRRRYNPEDVCENMECKILCTL